MQESIIRLLTNVEDQLTQVNKKLALNQLEMGVNLKQQTYLTTLIQDIKGGNWLSVRNSLQQLPSLENAGELKSSLLPNLNEIVETLKEPIRDYFNDFPANFEKACKSVGLTIDTDSRYPKYYFGERFLTLEIFEAKCIARLSTTEGVLCEISADIPIVVAALKHEYSRLYKSKFDPAKFLKKLRHHYKAILAKDKLPDGSAIHIRRITTRLGKNQDKFRTDEFIIELSKLLRTGKCDIEGKRMELLHTKNTTKGLFIPGQSGGYVGFIQFSDVKKMF